MQDRTAQDRAIAAAVNMAAVIATAIAVACSQQPVVGTATPAIGVAAGTAALYGPIDGLWLDTIGGVWMDTTGVFWTGVDRNTAIGPRPGDIAMMSNANIVAHLMTRDSLEIVMSQAAADRARSTTVRDFARRMVTDHAQQLRTGSRLVSDSGMVPLLSYPDTAGSILAKRMMSDLADSPSGTTFDRRFMRYEVVMHQHVLGELTMMRSRASGVALQLVDQTIPVVRQHLADARALWQEIGGSAATY